MFLDHLYIREEVVAVVCIGDTLRLSLRWEWEDLPYLLSLSPQLLLRWAHLDDPEAGIPVTVERWCWKPHDPTSVGTTPAVELHLRLVHLADS